MYAPETNDMLKLLERICLGEGMILEDEKVALEIVLHSQNDYKKLIVELGEILRLFDEKVIKYDSLKKYFEFIEQKDVDRSIYDNTGCLFSHYDNINSILKMFENNKTNMPLMVHQNHFTVTTEYIKDKSNTAILELSADIAGRIAEGDVIDNHIYSEQNWSLQETHGFYTCIYPSFKLNKNINTKKLENDSKYPYYKPVFSPKYPKDLNRTSTRCINYKNVKFANEYFHDMTIDDYVMAKKLIKNLLEDNRVDECKKLIKEYNLTAQGIMFVLKIDKINGTQRDVSKPIEKKIKDIAIEPVRAAIIKKI